MSKRKIGLKAGQAQVVALVRLDLDHGQFVEAEDVATLPEATALRLAELGLAQVMDVLPLEEAPAVAVLAEPEAA